MNLYDKKLFEQDKVIAKSKDYKNIIQQQQLDHTRSLEEEENGEKEVDL